MNKENIVLVAEESTGQDKLSNFIKLKKSNLDEQADNDIASVSVSTTKQIEWSPENELIMVEWCDVAQCYKWLNTKSHAKYSNQHAWFTIPAITLSTISGTASFAQASLPLEYQTYAPMVIGTINIFIGILTTIQQYLKISELNESHRVAAIAWDKYARNIRIELAKAPCERMDAGHFLKLSRQEFDRLMETSPSIPVDVTSSFISTFSKQDEYVELRKPDICDIIVSSNLSRHRWYLNENANTINKSTDSDDKINLSHEIFIKQKEDELTKKELVMKKREQDELDRAQKRKELQHNFSKSATELANKIKNQTKQMDDYVAMFYNTVGRRPINEEIVEYFQGKLDADIMQHYLKKYTTDDPTEHLPV